MDIVERAHEYVAHNPASDADVLIVEMAGEIGRLRAALTKIRFLEASDADTWIWQAQEEAREALERLENAAPEKVNIRKNDFG